MDRLAEVGTLNWAHPADVEALDSSTTARSWQVPLEHHEELTALVHRIIVRPDHIPAVRSDVTSEFAAGHIAIRFAGGYSAAAERLPLTSDRMTYNRFGEKTWILLGVAQKIGMLVVASETAGGITAAVVPITDHALHGVTSRMQRMTGVS